jgi:hypothetical protein
LCAKPDPQAENVAALDHTTLVRLLDKVIAYGITAVIGLVAYFLIKRARTDPSKPATVGAIKHEAQMVAGVPVVIAVLALLGWIAVAAVLGAPLWWAVFLVPVVAWMIWWMPGSRRRITSQASVFIRGLPSRVSAFVADVPEQARWSPGAVSYTPQLAGPQGPRFASVERGPDGREYRGVITLTRDQPGVEVDIELEGAGSSGDYYNFAAQDGGTLVTKRTVVELPYAVALIGGTLIARGAAAAARQRRINEVQALKAAFESSL